MKFEFDAPATHQPSMVHKVKMSDTMVFPEDELSILIPPIDFIIPNAFHNVLEQRLLSS